MKRDRYYTYRSLHREREYGAFWYSGLWRVLRPVLVALCVALVVFGAVTTGWNALYNRFAAPVNARNSAPVPFEVASGASLTRVSNNLEAAGLIRSATVFKYYCDFSGLGQKIQAGNYFLDETMSMAAIAETLTLGDGVARVRNITLIPGWTAADFASYLVERGILDDSARFLELCRTGRIHAQGAASAGQRDLSDYYYVSDALTSGTARQRAFMLEGYLAADTYEVYTNATEEDILFKLLSQTDMLFSKDDRELAEALLDERVPGWKNWNRSAMDVIFTLASLVEKEAKTADFAKVAAVFYNRLKAGMKLESDVSIHYVTGVPRMALSQADLAVDSPYNTYRNEGLPPGPICSPSRAAIRAVLNPWPDFLAEGRDKGCLFFCARDPASGELAFARTLEEHEMNVAQYQESWHRWDEERGIE